MGKMPLYTMLQKARSAGGWTMVAQLAVSYTHLTLPTN